MLMQSEDERSYPNSLWLTNQLNKFPRVPPILLSRTTLALACLTSKNDVLSQVEEYVKTLITLCICVGETEFWLYAADVDDVLHIVLVALKRELRAHREGHTVLYQARNRGFLLLPESMHSVCGRTVTPCLFDNFGLQSECMLHSLCFNYSETMPHHVAEGVGLPHLSCVIVQEQAKNRRECVTGMLEVYLSFRKDRPELVLLG